MKRLVIAILVSTLGTAATITFPQTAKADYPGDHYSRSGRENRSYYDRGEDRRRYEHRGDRRYYEHRGDYYGYHPHYYNREYYPSEYYEGGYYSRPRSNIQLVIPLIFR
ncbi:MAG: hypothetical protein PUP91_13470 [Rhizonema sp. PD37]|nr:hypothetical protein [Rhizonema sp. PD37]